MSNALRVAVMNALLMVGAGAGWPQEASAQVAAPSYRIEAGELDAALRQYASQSGLQVMYSADLVQGLRSRGLSGAHTPAAALDRLLQGSGLEAEQLNPRTLVLRKARPAAHAGGMVGAGMVAADADPQAVAPPPVEDLEAVKVFGTMEDTLNVGSKTGQSLRETPKSVSVVTRERIEAQNLTSLGDVLKQTTGVSTMNYSVMDSYWSSRGFRVQTLQLDGGAPAYTGNYGITLLPDMAIYDHIEMLRGVDGMYSGAGEPGGVINMVRKRAKDYNEVNLIASVGSWNFRRFELDATGPLSADGRLRGRVAGAVEDKDYFYDRAESGKRVLFGTLEYDLTPSTLLIAGANYDRRRENGIFSLGLPRYSDGRVLDVPRSTALNSDWSHWYLTSKEVFFRVDQKYGDSGVLKLNLTHMEQDNDYLEFRALGSVDPQTLTGPKAVGGVAYFEGSTQDLFDLSANGLFDLFGREHRYTVGVDHSRVDGGGQKDFMLTDYGWPGSYPVDVFNYDPSIYPEPPREQIGYYPVNEESQNGLYVALGLQVADPLRLTLGGRYGRYRYRSVYQETASDGTPLGAPSPTRYDDSKFVPSVALSWDFSPNWSAYASYAETFKVQANLRSAPMPGTPLGPVTGDGYEIGLKGTLLGFLNASAAIYRVERNGQGERDPAYPWSAGPEGSFCCYLPLGNIASEGLDTEVSGVVMPGWQMSAGYTFNRNEYLGTQEQRYNYTSEYLHMTPRHLLKVWSTWQLPDAYSRWSMSLGVVAQSETYMERDAVIAGLPVNYRFAQPFYATWNASVKYQLTDDWSIGLYGENIFDKRYFQLLGDVIANNGYGTPANYVLTLRGSW